MSQEKEWLLREKFGGEKSSAFFAACARLDAGEPLAYIIGNIPFLNCTIWLDSHPLIPRPETELWTEKAITVIERWSAAFGRAPRVLDLCAGSGCIGLAVAKAITHASVDFAEIDLSHFPTIEKNIEENGIDHRRCSLHHSDLFEKITETYDFILSNPPYIDETLGRTDHSVIAYEPSRALFGGTDGMEVVSKMISEAPHHLERNGQLWLEHEPEQTERIHELSIKNGFSVSTHPDQYGIMRYSVLVLQ
ncbi:MAG TPA: peptide chain release factor N(5)-glutamine methyltransferase [Candidatus Paceibacterota bacterium]